MSSKKPTQHGGGPSGVRKSARKRCPKQRQSLSPNPPKNNIIKAAASKSTSKVPTVIDERVLSLSKLKPITVKENSAIWYVTNQEEVDDVEQIISDDILDHLQWECESMLSDLLVRKKQIKTVSNLLSSVQEVDSQNKVENNCKEPIIFPKIAAELSDNDECSSNDVEYEYDSPENEDLPPKQNQSAKKFWSQVKPYLADVSEKDLKWLEDLVMSYSSKLDKIPPLGEHYTKRWAREEMQNQQASSSSCQPNMKTRFAERVSPDVVELINRVNNAARGGNGSTPIYQKVIAAILEHSNMSQKDIDKDSEIDSDAEDKQEEMSNICEEFYGEQNIIKQLETLGLIGNQGKQVPSFSSLPHSSSQATDENDEILEELVKCDAELSNLREMNKNHLTTLLERCRERHSQQKKKNRLQKLDNQILNLKKQGNSQKKVRMTGLMELLLDKRTDCIKRLQSCNTDPISTVDSELGNEDVKSDESFDIVISDDCIVISDSE